MPTLRVLIYSPQQRTVIATASALAGEGFEVSGTTSEAEALGKFQSGACDLLLHTLPATGQREASWMVVMVRPGLRAALAIPTSAAQPLFMVDTRPEALRHVVHYVKGLQETSDTGALSQVASAVAGIAEQGGPHGTVSRMVEALASVAMAQVWLLAPRGQEVGVEAHSGGPSPPPSLVTRLATSVLSSGQPLQLLDPGLAPAEWKQEVAASGGLSSFALPLRVGQQVEGVVVVARERASPLTRYEVQVASLLQPMLALALQHQRQAQETQASQGTLKDLHEQLERRQQEIRALNHLMQGQQTRLMELEEQVQTLGEHQLAALRTLANLTETGDPLQPGPSEHAANWTAVLVRHLDLPHAGLVEAAYLHDVGMPRASHSQDAAPEASQRQQVMRHPFLAEKVAEALGLPLETRLAVKHHHENYDGTGYPDGLARDSIPIGSRILRVVDELVKLTVLPEQPLPAAEAVVRLKASAGREYDPQLVQALEELVSARTSGSSDTEVISTVSHELRSPLTFLVGYSELLAAEQDLPEEARERAREIYQEALHMSELVEDLLNVSRYEAGRAQLRRQEVDLGELIRRSVTKAQAKTTQHQITAHLPEQALHVEGDPDKLLQVLDNLLDNAVKYSPEGGEIVAKAGRRHGEVLVSVSDQGVGIPEDQQGHLFEKFFRVESPLKYEVPGTGLGLSLCKLIVEAHGGRIWAESAEGQGSTFYFTLPEKAPA